MHRKAEGASILVAPLNFVTSSKLIFLRLEAATELQGLLEVKIRSRFLVILIGPIEKQMQLYEVGRAISTCLADDVCREMFYSARSKEDIMQVVQDFNRGTMVIPPSEWNPKIRIEPPDTFLSKVGYLNKKFPDVIFLFCIHFKEDRKKVPELTEYIHNDDTKMGHEDHMDPTLKGSRK